jgi:hypothetical protein
MLALGVAASPHVQFVDEHTGLTHVCIPAHDAVVRGMSHGNAFVTMTAWWFFLLANKGMAIWPYPGNAGTNEILCITLEGNAETEVDLRVRDFGFPLGN